MMYISIKGATVILAVDRLFLSLNDCESVAEWLGSRAYYLNVDPFARPLVVKMLITANFINLLCRCFSR